MSRALAVVPGLGESSSWERLLLETVRPEFRGEVEVCLSQSHRSGSELRLIGRGSGGWL